MLWVIALDMLRVCIRHLSNKPVPPLSEVPHQMTRLEEAWQRD